MAKAFSVAAALALTTCLSLCAATASAQCFDGKSTTDPLRQPGHCSVFEGNPNCCPLPPSSPPGTDTAVPPCGPYSSACDAQTKALVCGIQCSPDQTVWGSISDPISFTICQNSADQYYAACQNDLIQEPNKSTCVTLRSLYSSGTALFSVSPWRISTFNCLSSTESSASGGTPPPPPDVVSGSTPPPPPPCDYAAVSAAPNCAGLFQNDLGSFSLLSDRDAFANAAKQSPAAWDFHFGPFLSNYGSPFSASTAPTQCQNAYKAYYCLSGSGVQSVCQAGTDFPTCGMRLCSAAEKACNVTSYCQGQSIARDVQGCYAGIPASKTNTFNNGASLFAAPVSGIVALAALVHVYIH